MIHATAEVSIDVEASPKQVWDALTTPEVVREYFFSATVTTDWKVGSPIIFAGEWNGWSYADKGEILVFHPCVELSYSHWSPLSGTEDAPENYHVVEIALAEAASGTKVTLTQSNLTGGITDSDRANREDYERNWKAMLDGLKATVER